MAGLSSPAAVDLNLLQLLAELIATPSPTAVARRLGKTQSAVSHGLAQLRVMLGDPLFVRVGRGLVPTPRALALVEPISEWSVATSRLLSRAHPPEPAKLRRTFRIASTDAGEHLVVAPLVERLRELAPGVAIEIGADGDRVEDSLLRGKTDVLLGYDVRAVDGLVAQRLCEDEFVVASAVRRTLTLADYAGAPHILVAPRGTPGSVVDAALARRGLRRFVALRTASFASALAAVRGPLVLTLPRRFAEVLRGKRELRLLRPPLELPRLDLRLVFATATRDDPTLRWFRELLREAVPGRSSPRRSSGSRDG